MRRSTIARGLCGALVGVGSYYLYYGFSKIYTSYLAEPIYNNPLPEGLDSLVVNHPYIGVGVGMVKAPLPLIGLAVATTFGFASRAESTRREEPYWGPVKGIGAGMLINAATSGLKLGRHVGQYAPSSLKGQDSSMQFLEDMIASGVILGLTYAATAGIMNLCEGIYRSHLKRKKRRTGRRPPVQ